MVRHEPRQIYGNDYCFVVTDLGREYVCYNSPKPPKQTRGQKRYLAWLSFHEVSPDTSFGDWIKGVEKQWRDRA